MKMVGIDTRKACSIKSFISYKWRWNFMKKSSVFASVLIFALLLIGSIAFASSTENSKTISISKNSSVWTYCHDTTRTGASSYISERCVSVDTSENVSTIKTAVFNSNMAQISDVYTLTAGASSYSSVHIRQGYLTVTNIYIGFRGSKTVSANYDAWVKYKTN